MTPLTEMSPILNNERFSACRDVCGGKETGDNMQGMSAFPTPKEFRPAVSICSDWQQNRFFWVSNAEVEDLEQAWDKYVSDRFRDDFAESMAEEEFFERIETAMKGRLKPVLEVKPLNEAPGVYEIRWNWEDNEHFIGARLFHKEEREQRWIISAQLMCKRETRDTEVQHYQQTNYAKRAGKLVEQSKKTNWNNLNEYKPDNLEAL